VSGVLVRSGFSVGESFLGQSVTEDTGTGFELLTGTPAFPLQLRVPASGNGISITETITGNRQISGLSQGVTNDDIGEGAISFLFDIPATAFALSFSSDQADTMRLLAYDEHSQLIDSLVVPRSVRPISFISNGAAVKGLSITNNDPGGISVDFLQLILVPEPSSMALLLVGCSVQLLRRRRRQN
jgi:hypothetical protein